jgi:PAS domain S-box-containing protein
MLIATIALAGISDPRIAEQLIEHRYDVAPLADNASLEQLPASCALLIVDQSLIGHPVGAALERLRFLSTNAPLVVHVPDPGSILPDLAAAFRAGTADYLLKTEIDLGLTAGKIDAIFLNSRINESLGAAQKHLDEKQSLENEIAFRSRVLEHERALNTNIMSSITAGIVILDPEGILISINDAGRKLLGLETAHAIGVPVQSVFPAGFLRNVLTMIGPEGRTIANPQRDTLGDRQLEIYAYPVVNFGSRIQGAILLINDITEREKTAIALQQAEKLATVGTMLSGISHELRNPLSIISARTQRAIAKPDFDRDWAMKSFVSIDKQTTRCASLVNNLLGFARNTATVMAYHAIDDILDETLSYASYQNNLESVTVSKQCDMGLRVFGDRSRYVQVFLNLVSNAVDAMAGHGTLTIAARRADGGGVLVEVCDTGPGITPDIGGKIFDPFFTTKAPGSGTGLGLSIVHKIVRESGGEIWFESKPGRTSFFVKLSSRGKPVE